jgi:hypothetical protein
VRYVAESPKTKQVGEKNGSLGKEKKAKRAKHIGREGRKKRAMRLHDAVRYALYVSRSLIHPDARFGTIPVNVGAAHAKNTGDRTADAVVIRSALNLFGKILTHGFGSRKGKPIEHPVGSDAVVVLMEKIMDPPEYEEGRIDGDVLLEQEIIAFWRRMRVVKVTGNVRDAIRQILMKLYVGANIQVHPSKPAKDAPKAKWDAWRKTKDKKTKKTKLQMEKDKLEVRFTGLFDARIQRDGNKRATGGKGTKAPRSRGSGGKMQIVRVDNYEDVVPLMAIAFSEVYVSAEANLNGDDICQLLANAHAEYPILLCKGFRDKKTPGTLTRYQYGDNGFESWRVGRGGDLSAEDNNPILVAEDYGGAKNYNRCRNFWSSKGENWSYIAVGGDDAEMVTKSRAVVGHVSDGSRAKKMIGVPTCESKLDDVAPSVLRTFSSDLVLANAPPLDRRDADQKRVVPGGLKMYVGCAKTKMEVKVAGEKSLNECDHFVLRVEKLEGWKTHIETLLQLACQSNVFLVTTEEQREEIEKRQREKETGTAGAAKGTGDDSKQKKKGSTKPRTVAGITVNRIKTYHEVVYSMLESAEHNAVIYIDSKAIGDAREIARFVARRFDSLVIVSSGYRKTDPGKFVKYMEVTSKESKEGYTGGVSETEVATDEPALGATTWKSVLLVVEGHENAEGVTGCIKHCRQLLKWTDQDWRTIVVGASETKSDVPASLVVGAHSRIFQNTKMEGSEVTRADDSGEQSTELRTFHGDLRFTNVPNLTPVVKGTRTILGGLEVYEGSSYVSIDVSRNDVVGKEEPMVFALRVMDLPDWEDEIQRLVTLAMQKNVMLVTDEEQHNAMVEWVKKNGAVHNQGAGKGGKKRKKKPAAPSPMHEDAEGEADPGPVDVADEGEGEPVTWLGPARILGKTRMYLEVQQADCGNSWVDVNLSRASVKIAFLQVRQLYATEKDASATVEHHAGIKKHRHALYIRCDSERNVTGEYASNRGTEVEKLGSAEDVSKKLGELETLLPEGKKLTVYILCEHIDGPSGA